MVHAASKEIVSLVSDRRLDVVNFGIAFNHPRVREIAKNASPVLTQLWRKCCFKGS